jgi:GNAT superfamily N-acetyltransferase
VNGDTAPGITIRRATPDDLEDVLRLRLALLREYPDHPIYGRLRPDAEALARPVFAAQLASGNEVMFLATRGAETVAVLRAVEAAAAPFLVPDRYCYVSSVYVIPAFRRRGILRHLLDRAIEWADDRGLMEMRLHSVGTRETASAAWDALGFDIVEQVRVRRLEGRFEKRMANRLKERLEARSRGVDPGGPAGDFPGSHP